MKLLFATNNRHKLQEVREILGQDVELVALREAGIDTDIPETQETLEGNASQKAWFIYNLTGHDCIADDTGLEIEALDGRPGVYSARYAGDGCTFDDNVQKVLKEMQGKENRRARFRCVISLILRGNEYLFEGVSDGCISDEPAGSGGFGYDPVFVPEGCAQSFALMPPAQKNAISHRGRAVEKMKRFLMDKIH